MSSPHIVRSSSLCSDHGGSDKVYNIQIVENGGGYEVHYQNGRRGGTLASGTKTPSPVSMEEAVKIFDRLEKDKRNGSSHYRPVDANPDSYVPPAGDRELSGLMPQLLVEVDGAGLEKLIVDQGYVLQQKYDGERLQTKNSAGNIKGSNKKGFVRPVPEGVKKSLLDYQETDFDGELVGNCFYLFDMTRLNGEDIKGIPYAARLEKLEKTVISPTASLVPVRTYRTAEQKRAAVDRIREQKGEGVVGKSLKSTYEEGRSKLNVKFKFKASATCFVLSHTKEKRSVRYGLVVGGVEQDVGSVTIPSSSSMPAAGELIEIEYLYAFPGTHALSQAVYKGSRTDQLRSDCDVSQLKYVSGPVDDADDDATHAAVGDSLPPAGKSRSQKKKV